MAAWTTRETTLLQELRNAGKTWEEIGREIGRTSDSCHNRWKRVTGDAPTASGRVPDEGFEMAEVGDTTSISSVSYTIRTVDEALAFANIDTSVWEVAETTLNAWEVAGKKNAGQDADGRWQGEELWKQTLWQVKVKLRRRAPKAVQDGVRQLLDDLRSRPIKLPRPARRRARDPHLLEMVLFDPHFGKRCWGREVDGADYDLEIAESIFVNAVNELLERAACFEIDKIVFPLGQDFFQANNEDSQTSHGTVVDSVDDRLSVVFRAGCRAVLTAIQACREVADVEVLWVPGNHDPTTSWFLCEVLAARFGGAKDRHVAVDNGPTTRKYRQYGQSLIGYTHAYDEKIRDLPLIMAAERPQAWSETKYRAWRCGHLHKRAQFAYTAGDTFNGVRVDILPSLSGTDAWHYRKGYVRNGRTAECYLHSRDAGYVGHFSTKPIDA